MKIKEADKFIGKTRTLEWKAKRKKELAKILKSNKTCRKTELLGHPKKLTAKHFEFFFRGMTVKYIKSKEANLVTAFHQISQYMTTIDEQSDTILWLKADLEDRKASHEIYYERILQWQEIVEAKNEEIRKVREDRKPVNSPSKNGELVLNANSGVIHLRNELATWIAHSAPFTAT